VKVTRNTLITPCRVLAVSGVWFVRKLALVALVVVLVLLTAIQSVYSSYRKSHDIPVKANLYILDASIEVSYLGNYGVLALYLAPEGGYAYGVAVLKDPDEPLPHIYAIAGGQSAWYSAGFLNTNLLRFRIVLDYSESKLVAVLDSTVKEFKLGFTPQVKKLYISVFNATSRAADTPAVTIKLVEVRAFNKTLSELGASVLDLNTTVNGGVLVLSIRDLKTGVAPVPATTTLATETASTPTAELPETPEEKPQPPTQDYTTPALITVLAFAVIAVAAIIDYIITKRAERSRSAAGSPGP